MSAFRIAVLFYLCACGAVLAQQTNVTETTTLTIDGVKYEDVRWGRLTPATVTIFHKTGIATLQLEKLPLDTQKRLGYDPKKASEYRAAEAQRAADASFAGLKGTIGYLDARFGFRDLTFGQAIAECPGMRPLENRLSEGGKTSVQTYVRDTDELKIGAATLESIEYLFYRGRLMSVEISAKGWEKYSILSGAFEAAYGPGESLSQGGVVESRTTGTGTFETKTEEQKQIYSRVWFGERVKADVTCFIKLTLIRASIGSKEIEARKEADEKADRESKAKEGAKGL